MPVVNYCRKCKAETPLGESCPYCGGKLAQTGEQISFGLIRLPKKEWFAWNQYLRIVLPVLALVFVIVVAAEAAAAGTQGVITLLTGGFWRTLMILLALVVGFIWLMLHFQGTENVHVVLDKQGVHVRTYVPKDQAPALYARFLSEQAVEKLAEEDDRPALENLLLVRKSSLPWNEISRIRIWHEESCILFYRPFFWQAAAVRVPVEELATVEEYVRKKLKRNKKVRILPKR
ncbi:MAG: hypothetical protein IKK75_15330 [Clostridia bacterium]|nr:hypothetical protein [Clostridia bacterium]